MKLENSFVKFINELTSNNWNHSEEFIKLKIRTKLMDSTKGWKEKWRNSKPEKKMTKCVLVCFVDKFLIKLPWLFWEQIFFLSVYCRWIETQTHTFNSKVSKFKIFKIKLENLIKFHTWRLLFWKTVLSHTIVRRFHFISFWIYFRILFINVLFFFRSFCSLLLFCFRLKMNKTTRNKNRWRDLFSN